MRVSVSMISDGILVDSATAVHTDGTPSNVFHNDDFGDAHLDPGTLRHATSCWADSVSPSSPLLLCAVGTSYGRV